MPAITRECPPYLDLMKCLRQADRDDAIKDRLHQIVQEIQTYNNNHKVVRFWRRELWDEWEFLKNKIGKQPQESSISDEDIEQAKRYPIDKIIDFSNGVATAWCHADKTPSLTHWKDKNLAFCFPCHKAYSPIDAIMEIQGMDFTEAVKCLR